MSRALCGRLWQGVLGLVVVSAVGVGAAASAGAATGPHGRVYELVDSGRGGPGAVTGAVISDDGSRVVFLRQGYSPTLIGAVRTPSGWQASSMVPAGDSLLRGSYGTGVVAYTPDRRVAFITVYPGIVLGKGALSGTLVRVDAQARQTVFFKPVPYGIALKAVASDDGEHLFGVLTLGGPLYDLAHEAPVVVSVLPDESVQACNVRFVGGSLDDVPTQHWNSVDGSRVLFVAQAGDPCAGPRGLYLRDLVGGTARLLSGPPVSGPERDATFLQADRTVRSVVFSTSSQLDDQDTNGGVDVYRWSEGEGDECLTCLVADAAVEDALPSEDLSHVYFVSQHQLALGAQGGVPNLYVWHLVGGERRIDFVAPWEAFQTLTNNATQLGALTPDGNTLIFASDDAALDGLSGRSNGGHLQYYRYDDEMRALTCVSCPVSGAPTHDITKGNQWGGITIVGGVPPFLYRRVLSDDGERFAFVTPEALVASDVNGGADIYEWYAGDVALITDGVSDPGREDPPNVALYGMSADGTDLIFATFAALAPDAVDGTLHLYDARVGGGLPFAAPVSCEGESCQKELSPLSSLQDVVSAGVEGAGNRRRLAVKVLRTSGETIVLRVRVPGTGVVRVSGRRVREIARRVARAGAVVVRVRLRPATLRRLQRERRLHVGLRAVFVSRDGGSSSARVRVAVRARVRRGR